MRFQTNIFSLVFLVSFVIGSGNAQTVSPIQKIKSQLQEITHSSTFRHVSVGFCLLDAQNGQILASHAPHQSLMPASTMKLITTAAAYEYLGPTYVWKTQIYIDGKVDQGKLKGNLIIRGGGDPSLGSSRWGEACTSQAVMARIFSALTTAGISSIEGNIIADGSIYEDELVPPTWIWLDMGNYFGAGPSGLSFNENMYQLVFKPGKKVGDSTQILKTIPALGLQFQNRVTTGPAGQREMAFITGAFYSPYRCVTGTIPAGKAEFSIKGSLPDPPKAVAEAFKDFWISNDGKVSGSTFTHREWKKSIQYSSARKIDSIVSPTLTEIVTQTNFKSINLGAEHLIKHLSLRTSTQGNTLDGTKVLESFLSSKKIPLSGVYIADGSGLAPNNVLSAKTMASFLWEVKKEKWFNGWLKTIPVAGKSGTVSSFCKGTKAEGKVWVKSGTMQRTKCYAGYIQGKSGALYPFALFVNQYFSTPNELSQAIEQWMETLIELP